MPIENEKDGKNSKWLNQEYFNCDNLCSTYLMCVCVQCIFSQHDHDDKYIPMKETKPYMG